MISSNFKGLESSGSAWPLIITIRRLMNNSCNFFFFMVTKRVFFPIPVIIIFWLFLDLFYISKPTMIERIITKRYGMQHIKYRQTINATMFRFMFDNVILIMWWHNFKHDIGVLKHIQQHFLLEPFKIYVDHLHRMW